MTNSHPETDNDFDKAYRDAEEMFGHPYQELQDYFKDHRPKGSVLDLGAGQGRDALYLASLGYQVTAVDVSRVGIEQMLKKAGEANLQIEGLAADVLKAQIGGKFDIVVFDMLLHGFEKEEQTALLGKYADNLSPGGMMCIIYPDDMTTDHFMDLLNTLPYEWTLRDEIVIRDVPKLDDVVIDFTFVMMCVQRSS